MKMLVWLAIIFFISYGMDRQQLRSMYKNDQHQWVAPALQAPVCGICLDAGNLKSLNCHPKHKFHSSCIEEWRLVKNTCPVCRAEIIDSALCNCLKAFSRLGVCIPSAIG